jgi:hypothetical protein
MNTKLAVVYYNRGKPNLFRVHVDVRLSGLKDHLHQINGHLNHIDKRKVDTVEYRRLSIDLNVNEALKQQQHENYVLYI